MAKRMFQGSIVALVTPFRDGKVDVAALKALVEFQIAGGTDGIVPCGTTGESPTLDHDEHKQVIDIVIQAVNKRVPVIAGTGSNSTAEAVSLTKHAKHAGADGALIVLPYYNKPTQRGMIEHCRAIADALQICPWCSITSPAARASTCCPRRWRSSPTIPTSWG
jgi:4-hydroxy-tetrahydrodipicolinate synthase